VASVEWASSVTGPWTNNWAGLGAVTADSNGMIQVSVPMFYRVRGVAQTNVVTTNMVWIPPGTFVMGSPASEAQRYSDETQHTVTLTKGFYMGKYAVTQGEYLALMGSNPSYFTTRDYNGNTIPADLNRPVEQVSWDDATNYCAHLTAQEQAAGRLLAGWVYRLPTESEREYACRAGTTTAFHYGSALHGGMANFYDYYEYDAAIGDIYFASPAVPWLPRTTTVGSYQPNAWGLHDMHGNVWEWCRDWYGTYPTSSVIDPQGPTSGSDRVFRGGGWFGNGRYCRSAARFSRDPDFRFYDVGFRVVLAPGQP
jgi:formylglycine-generating enzyme required for sulfatase activity